MISREDDALIGKNLNPICDDVVVHCDDWNGLRGISDVKLINTYIGPSASNIHDSERRIVDPCLGEGS